MGTLTQEPPSFYNHNQVTCEVELAGRKMLKRLSWSDRKELLRQPLKNNPCHRQDMFTCSVWQVRSSAIGLRGVRIDPPLCTPVQKLNSAEAPTNVTAKFSLH